MTSANMSTIKKLVGRPRKCNTTLVPIAKRPVGRPRKCDVVIVPVVKRPVGRPRKCNVVTVSTVKSFTDNQNKNFVNSYFAAQITELALQIKINNFSEHYVGALDGSERNTANALIGCGIDQSSILLVEDDAIIASSHHNANICVHEGNLLDFADDKHDEMYSQMSSAWRIYKCLGWYFDTCRTIPTEKIGILNTICKTNLIDGSILAFTFCKRGMSLECYEQQKNLFVEELNNCLKSKGFRIEHYNHINHHYNGHLMFGKSKGMPMNSFDCTVCKL
jgi:hypothetical protein